VPQDGVVGNRNVAPGRLASQLLDVDDASGLETLVMTADKGRGFYL
jgi:hypothetical protein